VREKNNKSPTAVVLFIFVGNVGIKPATTPLINRFGFRGLLLASTVITAVVMAGLGFTTATTPLPVIAALALVSGITRSTGLTVYSTVGFADMAPEQMRDANTLFATTTQLAAGLAVTVATVALRIGRPVPRSRAQRDGLQRRVLPARRHLAGRGCRGAAAASRVRRRCPPAVACRGLTGTRLTGRQH
jgi:hypothetical protein